MRDSRLALTAVVTHDQGSALRVQACDTAIEAVLAPLVCVILTRCRWPLVAGGGLEYLPFAALPVPVEAPNSEDTARPATAHATLASAHEIVRLPSASVLALLRRDVQGRQAAPRAVAILADPVFDARDPRVQTAGRVSAGTSRSTLSRLSFRVRRRPRSPPWPALSGLVLSQVDRRGAPVDGYIRLHDIYNMQLSANLVVLSACHTALGKDIKGEGLVSLARAFMYAGAPRIVASLWEVNDLATAELMKWFYRGMLKDGLPPAAALRAAQMRLAENPRWSAPYFWAGFVIQGDWR